MADTSRIEGLAKMLQGQHGKGVCPAEVTQWERAGNCNQCRPGLEDSCWLKCAAERYKGKSDE